MQLKGKILGMFDLSKEECTLLCSQKASYMPSEDVSWALLMLS